MQYKNFREADFASDEYFQQWVKNPTQENNNFWNNFLNENPDKQAEVYSARDTVLQLSERRYDYGIGKLKEEVWKSIDEQIDTPGTGGALKKTKQHKKLPLRWAVGFAIVAGLTTLGIYTFGILNNPPADKTPQITLKLDDGTLQVIDENAVGIITTTDGNKVGNQKKKVLIYKDAAQNATEPVYNELTVPYGKKFELVLADGSHVYLNSGSTLRYPVRFPPGKPRNVYLDGEAFFEVESDNTRPFTVLTDDMNTRVYGTKFNVTNYENEGHTFTVLVEGSVGVYQPEATDSIVQKIVPGQKAGIENQKIAVEAVNVYKYTAWTNGELYFLNDHFDVILRKLERHYNISINNLYKASEKERLTSSFKEGDSLELVLGILKKLQPFKYTRSGNTITITPP